MRSKSVCSIFLVVIILFGCTLVESASFARASTPVNGLIKTDTTWTKANSPYELTGPVGVRSGVTLTIEPGTIVDLMHNDLVINGTIIAIGTTADPITFDGGSLFLTSVSASWNEKTGKGSIIEHAIITKFFCDASAKIINSRIQDLEIGAGAPLVENNVFTGLHITDNSSALILGNTIENTVEVEIDSGKTKLVNNQMPKGINLRGPLGWPDGIAIVANNTIGASYDGIAIDVSHMHAEITGNYIMGSIIVDSGGQIIGDSAASATISNNVISGAILHSGSSGSIENNLIRDVGKGSAISITNNASVSNNTITNCDICITVSDDSEKAPTIAYNNFVGYKTNSIHWANSKDGDVKNNWWGTTDTNAISQSIFDNKNNYNLGTVNFTPFLTQANPQATPYIGTTMPNPTPEANQSPNSTGIQAFIYYFEVALVAGFVIICISVVVLVWFIRKSKAKDTLPL